MWFPFHYINKTDKILIEKVIRALFLLEGLAESGMDLIFKGILFK